MPIFPCTDWQVDERAFALTVLYWSRFVRHAIGPDADEWRAEFDIERDGNPILTITSRLRLRGVRVVMLAPLPDGEAAEDDDVVLHDFYPHMNVGQLADGETEVNELSFFARTGAAVDVARMLIQRHCIECAPPQELEDIIAADEERRRPG